MAEERKGSFKLQLKVVSSRMHPQQGGFPAAGVVLSEPMRRFECNLKGCCCSGWDIPFRLDDFLRLHEHLDETDRAYLTKGLKLVLEKPEDGRPIDLGEQKLHSLKLNGVGEDKHCRFLSGDGGCGVQVKYGVAALPDLCVDFPSFGYRQPDGPVELFFDPVCPEVLEQLGESDEPLRLFHQTEASGDAGFDLRAAHAATPVRVAIEGELLAPEALMDVRAACIEAFGAPGRAPWQSLAAVVEGIRTLSSSAEPLPQDFPREPTDPMPFLRFLDACLDCHSSELLYLLLARYRRFVFAIDLAPVLAQRAELCRHLSSWRPAFEEFLSPAEESLRPLQARYLAHRFGAPFVKQRGELREAADAIVHLYATALRIASALGATLRKPVDRSIFKVALGASEFFYRSLHLPHPSLPWYASAKKK